MEILFNHPRNIDGKHFAKGKHELDDKFAKHWYIKALEASGDIVILASQKIADEVEPDENHESSEIASSESSGDAESSNEDEAPSEVKETKKPRNHKRG